jgi:hypothetical protein
MTFAMGRENAMSSYESIRPSTMSGIKRLAKHIKVAKGVLHREALNQAATAAGYENFRHAQRMLTNVSQPALVPRSVTYPVFITAYWRNPQDRTSGRETLRIELSAPWEDLLKSSELDAARGLAGFVGRAPDHLEKRNTLDRQERARKSVCHAARTLQFVAATKLKPSRGYSRAYPKGDPDGSHLPGQDHVCVWFDQEKRYLIADEPYGPAYDRKYETRKAWCKKHGYIEKQVAWAGMHYPHDVDGTRLYLVAHQDKGPPLESLVKALNQLPSPPVFDNWEGESAPTVPYFVSPGAVAKRIEAEVAAKEKAKQKTSKPSGKQNTIGYIWTLVGPHRRPNAKMPIEIHAEVGRLLKSVLVESYHRKGVHNRVDAIRSELDEWTQREYNYAELPNEQFFDLYYREELPKIYRRSLPREERERHVESLAQVKRMLSEHYPDCAPLRAMLKRADAAISSLQSWGA